MAQFFKISGANLATPNVFDTYVSLLNIAHIVTSATTVVLTYTVASTSADVITITFPSDTSGSFARELSEAIMTAASSRGDGGYAYFDAPATFTNGQTPGSNKISTIAIA